MKPHTKQAPYPSADTHSNTAASSVPAALDHVRRAQPAGAVAATQPVPGKVVASENSFPFAALLGYPDLRQALLLAAVDTGIGGVLISGPRGTAKSTAARALAALLPGMPFVSLPLAASIEQLVGTLDLENVLRDGQVRLQPGLVARAHGGILYVDEVNLLPDALVDALLDVAASGVNVVERDGISQRHAARFVLIGTMNPEEGELRPQLLDRFGLSVALGNPDSAALRQNIVRTRLAFEQNPQAMLQQYAQQQNRLIEQVAAARTALPHVVLGDEVIERATQLALAAGVDGVRADLVLVKAARAHAALAGRMVVEAGDVDAVAEFALAHRRMHAPEAAPPPMRNTPPQTNSQPPAEPRQDSVPQGPTGPSQTQAASSPAQQAEQTGAAIDAPVDAPIDAATDAPNSAEQGGDGDWGALPPQPQTVVPIWQAQGKLPAKKA